MRRLGVGTVLVQVPGVGGPGQLSPTLPQVPRMPVVRELSPGEEITFGRGAPDRPVDLRIDHPGIPRVAGRIRAQEDFWLISNLSTHQTYVVENPEGGGEYFKVAPRRLETPVPFEFARVVLPPEQGRVGIFVFAPQHTFLDPVAPGAGGPDATPAAYPLDESAKYFLVLVALCEPRLRDNASARLPSIPDVVRRLSRLPHCQDITRSAVTFHIDYLARTKLRVRDSGAELAEGRADWQRSALVSVALRFDLVREEHLLLLEPTGVSLAGRR
jgi:hypothetical protein